jgi:cytidylate kinase
VEGRDIGSVVLPDAQLKVYLTASAEERARRRAAQQGEEAELGEVEEMIKRRDGHDSGRELSPLVVAAGAAVIDSTGRSVEEVVEQIIAML